MMSMTGYGRACYNDSSYSIEIEIRSINSRHFKFTSKIPQEFSSYEIEIKNLVMQKLQRGTINLTLNYLDLKEMPTVINTEVLKKYYSTLKKTTFELGINPPTIESLLGLPEVTTTSTTKVVSDSSWEKTQNLIANALDGLQNMRQKEGDEIEKDLEKYCSNIEQVTLKIESSIPSIVKNFTERVKQRISQFLQDEHLVVSEQDILKELAIFAEKIDISEEILRLSSHLKQFRATFLKKEPVGRTLDFLIQEMLRESNTIAAKANDAQCSQYVVEIKNYLEKMREQIQNIE